MYLKKFLKSYIGLEITKILNILVILNLMFNNYWQKLNMNKKIVKKIKNFINSIGTYAKIFKKKE